jgi:hypothetical protein
VAVDGTRILDGGNPSSAFVDVSGHDFWLRPGSVLIGHAEADFVPVLDFHGTKRTAPFDVGACESGGNGIQNAWRIQPGFKRGE